MADEKPVGEVDVTKAWAASQGQKDSAKKLRIYAALCWLVAIGTEIAAIVMLKQGKFQTGNMALLIGLLVVIAAFAIGGSVMWKKANRHDPASKADGFRFFVQNQLGAIITVLAFLPLLALIFLDKDMDPKNKKIAGGVGVVLALLATTIGIDFKPPSVEQYTEDMNLCATQIKSGQPTTACSPEVAEQAQAIARDSKAVAEATKSDANPNGLDKVYWIASEKAGQKADTEHVFHLCDNVSVLRGKTVNSGTVTEAYKENATRITKQIPMEQKQCGFVKSAAAALPAAAASAAAE
ncbi:hypothetical protein OKA06_04715 [Novosphingobium sp. MW5]|nr:hypothetical protein [Novosphingobium sp. MW5]